MNNDRFEFLREWGITLLSLALVVFGLAMVWGVFKAASHVGKDKDEEERIVAAYTRQKDTMEATGLVFLTTVLGYYFGRVPAAKAANDAKKQAAAANRLAANLRKTLHDTQESLLKSPGDIPSVMHIIERSLNTE
jgi:hypothetical protein